MRPYWKGYLKLAHCPACRLLDGRAYRLPADQGHRQSPAPCASSSLMKRPASQLLSST